MIKVKIVGYRTEQQAQKLNVLSCLLTIAAIKDDIDLALYSTCVKKENCSRRPGC